MSGSPSDAPFPADPVPAGSTPAPGASPPTGPGWSVRGWVRWSVPGALLALVAGGITLNSVRADAEPTLAPRSAAQLLVDVQTASDRGLSGTVVTRADLGLPSLPGASGGEGGLTDLLTGSQTVRLWYAGPERVRVALMGTTAETDLIRDGEDLWTWSSRTREVHHLRIPSVPGASERPRGAEALTGVTPQQAAETALGLIAPTTRVRVDGTARVAGRPVYELVLEPRDPGSLVGQVRIAVDSDQHVPLRFQVYPVSSRTDPAAEVAFTQVSFKRPDAERFRFVPPPGAEVVEETVSLSREVVKESGAPRRGGTATEVPGTGSGDSAGTTVVGGGVRGPGGAGESVLAHGVLRGMLGRLGAGDGELPAVQDVGSGWSRVVVATVGREALADLLTGAAGTTGRGKGASGAQGVPLAGMLLDKAPRVSGTWGSGRVLSGRLATVLITDDGRILCGLVSPERLGEVAATTAVGDAR